MINEENPKKKPKEQYSDMKWSPLCDLSSEIFEVWINYWKGHDDVHNYVQTIITPMEVYSQLLSFYWLF